MACKENNKTNKQTNSSKRGVYHASCRAVFMISKTRKRERERDFL